ncbi:MAG: rhodanese-like domain-containing protein [Treponema sp.]|nr:rhodanese-like domain-containing protein [Treponema sp.]
MKKMVRVLGIAVLTAIIGFSAAGCQRREGVILPGMGQVEPRTGVHNPHSLINVGQLLHLMGRDDVILVDVSETPTQVIPGAVWLDHTLLIHDVDGGRQMTQTLEVHEYVLGRHGISNDHTIVLYCNQFNLWATRILLHLRAIGHDKVKLLDGGTSAWIAAGGSVHSGPQPSRAPAQFRAVNRVGFFRADLADVLDAKHNPNWAILDVRTQAEWDAGRIPSAIQFTFPTDVRNPDGTFRSAGDFEELFRDISPDQRIIVYCLGGTRSANMWFVFTDILGWPQRTLLSYGWWHYEASGSPIER